MDGVFFVGIISAGTLATPHPLYPHNELWLCEKKTITAQTNYPTAFKEMGLVS